MKKLTELKAPMSAHERELSVAGLLDITLGHWVTFIKETPDEKIPEHLHDPIANLASHLKGVADEEHGAEQLYVQTIAMLCDQDVYSLVELLKGEPPFLRDE